MIRGEIETLGNNPRRCPVDPDWEFYGVEVRVLPVGKRHGVYRVLFTTRDDFVHILRVRDSARQTVQEELDGGQ
jgi:plasmid stabilization system protein ParE